MQWDIRLEAAGPHVRVTTRGVFTVEDHLRMIEDILSQPFWVPGMRAFFDHRQLDMAGTSYAVMSAAGENHLKHDARIGAGKAAVLMGSAAAFGSARQFEMLVEGQTSALLQVFLDPEKALTWLLQ